MCVQFANDDRAGRSTFGQASDPEDRIYVALHVVRPSLFFSHECYVSLLFLDLSTVFDSESFRPSFASLICLQYLATPHASYVGATIHLIQFPHPVVGIGLLYSIWCGGITYHYCLSFECASSKSHPNDCLFGGMLCTVAHIRT